jgi:hypothetical protein
MVLMVLMLLMLINNFKRKVLCANGRNGKACCRIVSRNYSANSQI